MNKSAIQKYAIWARNELIDQVKQRAYQYGISEKGYGNEREVVISGRVLTEEEQRQRQAFVVQIQKQGYQQAVEEVAYTWFNRFVALRFMEVNDYLPTHVRVFSDASGNFNPEILKDALHLDLQGLDKAKVSDLLNANKTEELYRYLLLTQCNTLNEALPEMFERLGNYTEMLLPNNILKADSVLGRLVSDITEDDFRDAVQIIGWMYQYYNTEPKQAVFDGLKKNIKITKEKIPAATQLFTPDWIVRYMVENSLGRLWLESHPNDKLRATWKYYLDEAEQTPEVAEKLRVLRSQSPVKSPEDIKLIDPCMGSGHILVYTFDVLMQIYESEGYNPRDAAKLILKKNIYGLDIDRRAYQLAYFSLMMKARQYNRRMFAEDVKPQVYYPAGWSEGEEYGSLVKVDTLEPEPQRKNIREQLGFNDNFDQDLHVWNFKHLLTQRYDVVVTNPPYMGGNGMSQNLSEFVKTHYPISKSDLFSAFIEKCIDITNQTGYCGMVTMQAWMFLSSYEVFRKRLLAKHTIFSLVQIGYNSFPEINSKVALAVSLILNKAHIKNYYGCYLDLTNKYPQAFNKERAFFLEKLTPFVVVADRFMKIPNSPLAYWVSEDMLKVFEKGIPLGSIADSKQGLATTDNKKYLRLWHEVSENRIGFGLSNVIEASKSRSKWFPYNKGGDFRKWYGNDEYVVNYSCDGADIKADVLKKYPYLKTPDFVVKNTQYYFRRCISWSLVSSGAASFRYKPQGFIFDVAGMSFFANDHILYLLALSNTKITLKFLSILAATINYQCGDIANIPVIINNSRKPRIEDLVNININICRDEWDSFETSWDFRRHPLVITGNFFKGGKLEPNKPIPTVPLNVMSYGTVTDKISIAFNHWEAFAEYRFSTLKANEEELNRIFIDIYRLQDELTTEVEDKDVTVRRADLGRDIRSFISYSVGCMFGRYSLDEEGLTYAGGDWDSSKYNTFIPDKDNVLPICDDEYFDDDIVGRFVEFTRVVYGAETLEENLKFIADALGGKGTSREVIRNYFLNGFYADHCKIYQKRPIYWLFDSGKKNGFKALIYLHRYSSDLLAKLRVDYVHEQQERYRTQLSHIDSALNAATGSERARLLKQQDELSEQLKEITAFEEKIHHLADQNIEIDLDDGVKVNYAKFPDVLAKI